MTRTQSAQESYEKYESTSWPLESEGMVLRMREDEIKRDKACQAKE